MDGNGRWAKQRNLPRTDGHAAGEAALFDVIEGAIEIGMTARHFVGIEPFRSHLAELGIN